MSKASQPTSQHDFALLDKSKLLRIIQAMVDAVLVFSPQGEVELCNPAFEETFHISITAAQSLESLFKVFSPDLPAFMLDVTRSGESRSREFSFYHNYQKKVFLLHVTPIMENHEITEGVAVFQDITQIKQTEKMRRDFVANVSHELRTPLSAINGYAETLLDGALDEEAVAKDFIQIIFNHSKRLSLLVADLLDLSKLESEETPFELSPTNLTQIIEKVVQLNKKQLAEKQIRLDYTAPDSFPTVLAHASNIEQVVTNLLDNAIKYTPEGGEIKVLQTVQKDTIQVDIEDTGIGIETKYIPRVFERFYRVDKARSRDLGGTGLGLAIVKHIIQSHGGEVWVKSVPGKGSTFSFTLQVA